MSVGKILLSWFCVIALAQAQSQVGAGNPPQAIPNPSLSLVWEGSRLNVAFTGTLQSAASVLGPWTNVANASTPWSVVPAQPMFFFRARTGESLFASTSIVTLTLVAPFQQYFNLAFAGSPDGIFPPRRVKPYFEGRVALGGYDLPATLRVRGNSSLQECPFPKLKLKISGAERPGTPFADAREIKIGTHCAEGGRGTIGRLRDERAAYREALAYEAMELLGFEGPRVRRAQIDYQDVTPTNLTTEVGWKITRNAVIFDDIEVVAARLGGRALSDTEIEQLADPKLDGQLVTDLEFFHTLLGNWDYGLGQGDRGIWNTDLVVFPNARLLPIAGDFDLSSWVTEETLVSAPRDYRPELPDIDRQARYQLEQIQLRANPEIFEAAIARFTPARQRLQNLIQSVVIDDAGRTNARRHVTAFFDALAEVSPN